MILTFAILFILIAVLISLLLSVKRLKNYRIGQFLLIFAFSSLVSGIFLTIFSSNEISRALIRQSWPVKSATIVETNIVGDRAYNPQLKCKYRVEENSYTLITDLNTPGFGRKRSRRQTAEIILKDFPVGSEVLIRYNPENPGEAFIRTGPYWSDYMKLSLGVLLFAIGLYVLLGITIKRFIIK
jgi:hypothetical protein